MSLAVIGPGRVGKVLARRWAEADLVISGFHGGRPDHAAQAVQFCGAGRVLEADDLRTAHRVCLAVPDAELAGVAESFAATAQSGSLWFHTSGFHDLDVLAPLQERGVRIGSLHPLCPFPDAEAGYERLPGQPAVCAGTTEVCAELAQLAGHAGMVAIELCRSPLAQTDGSGPKPGAQVDRRVYHAACVLAANGLTALSDLTTAIFAAGCGLDREQAATLTQALMRGALDTCEQQGARAALSGPVARGDLALVKAQLAALESAEGLPSTTAEIYRALQSHAAQMAGLAPEFHTVLATSLHSQVRDSQATDSQAQAPQSRGPQDADPQAGDHG